MHRFALILLGGASLFLGACTSAEGLAVGDARPPRPPDWPVDVYVDTDAPVGLQKAVARLRRPHELPEGVRMIGRVDAEGSDSASWRALWDTALEEVRHLGGDAVVVRRWSLPISGVDDCGGVNRDKLLALDVLHYPSPSGT